MQRSLVKDTVIYSFSDIILKGIAFLAFPIFTNLLSIEDYGTMSLVLTISGLTGMVMGFGVSNSLQRFYFDDQSEKGKGRKTLVSTGLLLVILLCLIGFAAFSFLFYFSRSFIESKLSLQYNIVLLAIAGNIPTQIIQYVFSTIRVQFKPVRYVIVSFINNLSGTILAIFLLYRGYGLPGYFLGFLFAPLAFIPIAVLFIKQDLIVSFDRKQAKIILEYGYPFIFAGLGYWLFGSIDRWVLNSYVSKEGIGIYSIAFKFAYIVYLIIGAFGQALSPLCVKMLVEEPGRIGTYFSKILIYLYAGMTLIGLGISIFANELIILTTPYAYWPAAKIIPVVIAALVIHSTSLISVLGLYYSKRTNIMTFCVFIAAGVNVIFNFLLVPTFGPLGAAITLILTYSTLTILYGLFSKKSIQINYDVRSIILNTAILALGTVVASWLGARPWSWTFIAIKLVVYVGLAITMVVFKVLDVKNVIKAVIGVVKR